MNSYITREILKKVPLDYRKPKGKQIELFVREIYLPQNKKADIFVYLQGGPGYASPRTLEPLEWMKVILKKYRLVLLDQRGTGRSQKIGPELCTKIPSSERLATYFSHFRAHQIVLDLEFLRKKFFRVKKWSLVCQSYGGFVGCSYLSFFPNSLNGAILCGGLPPLTASSPLEIYKKLAENISKKNQEFYETYPKDRDQVKKIVDLLQNKPIPIGNGGKLTAERFLDIGLMLGRSNGIKQMHLFLEDPFVDSSKKEISWAFASKVDRQTSYETNPIYAVLHESIYCDQQISKWSADQILKSHPNFQLENKNIFFYGETIRKKMFSEYGKLKGFRKCAHLLAKKENWPALYDQEQLAKNLVPMECIVYQDDYYVDYDYSIETSKAIQNCKTWVHSEWQHDSLRVHGKKLMTKLLGRLEKRFL